MTHRILLGTDVREEVSSKKGLKTNSALEKKKVILKNVNIYNNTLIHIIIFSSITKHAVISRSSIVNIS